MNKWIEVSKELPECDGQYEICNHPELEIDGIRRECTATAYYDGYGFQYLGVYRTPKYWAKHIPIEKKYGKQKQINIPGPSHLPEKQWPDKNAGFP